MAASTTILHTLSEGATERFDAVECLDERTRTLAEPAGDLEPGRYIAVLGPDRAVTIPLAEEPLRIGRGIGADVRLDESSVSRRHAIIDPSGERVRVLDDRSSNGTFLNGERVQQAPLRSGDEIALGRVRLRYLEIDATG